jgi:hypothetical protein
VASGAGRLDILGDVLEAVETNTRSVETLGRWHALLGEETIKLWQDNAALRDEMHALANRVESLTRVLASRTDHLA